MSSNGDVICYPVQVVSYTQGSHDATAKSSDDGDTPQQHLGDVRHPAVVISCGSKLQLHHLRGTAQVALYELSALSQPQQQFSWRQPGFGKLYQPADTSELRSQLQRHNSSSETSSSSSPITAKVELGGKFVTSGQDR